MKNIRVGYLKHDQNWNRNICCHRFTSVQLLKVLSLSRVLSGLTRRLGRRIRYLEHTVFGPVWPRVDILHVWSGICLSRRLWLVTSDVGLPFNWPKKWWTRGLRAMAGPSCRKIIFNSSHALQWQMRKLPDSGDIRDRILAKAIVLHTPQQAMISCYDEKSLPNNDTVRFTLVGHHFFRKGGLALLKALDAIRQEGAKVELTVVSKLGADGFLHVTERNKIEIKRQLSESSWIRWYPSLPNEQVLQMFRRSHVGVLLSFAESYGYSVLEAQANGCAILSTDIGALPELNNEECGWIVPIRDIPFDLNDSSSLWRLQERIVERLVPVLREIVTSQEKIREKGIRSLEKIKREHDPGHHKQCLEEIYHECVIG